MSGGVKRVRLDAVGDFLSLRKEAFGFELSPLPQSLQLPAAESLLNRVIKPRLHAKQGIEKSASELNGPGRS